MPDSPSKLSQFWQELKRRKVVRVITVYAAAAFVVLELVDILAPSLGLPDWTLNLVLILLIVGFVIAVNVSWIYDLHPEGGIVKTAPTHRVKAEEVPKSSNSWKIASYISFIVIVGLIVLNIIPRASNNRKVLEKSIAVLPLEYLSENPNKEYLANGVLDAITGHLSMIEGLRVMPRTSVEQYRENKKSAKEIGEELDVSYLIEGSFLMIENQVKLTIQLVVAEEGDHLFFKEYDRDYKDIIVVQSEVAKTIAKEIEVAITPEEKLRIEKVPTTNLTAYDFYQRGREEYYKYKLDDNNREALERAEDLYHYAIEEDSTFALAYVGLANVYRRKHYWEEFFSENFLDSVLVLADIALSFDDQLAEAYVIRGDYYRANNEIEQAIEEYDKAIRLNPNHWMAYWYKGHLYRDDDFVKTIDNYQKAASLYRGPLLPQIYRSLGSAYARVGFKEKGIYYIKEKLKLDNDSAEYYSSLAETEGTYGNFEKAIEFRKKSFAIDSTDVWNIFMIGTRYMVLGQKEESLEYYKKYEKRLETLDRLDPHCIFDLGYSYWVNGFKEEAEQYFSTGLEYYSKMIELDRNQHKDIHTYHTLAAIYAFRGDKDKAYEYLRLINQRQRMPLWMIRVLKDAPLFDSIRDEPEFQQIVREVEAKYQAEHERVRKWLEENDML